LNLVGLVAYVLVNAAMVLSCLLGAKGRVCELPFWMGMLGLGYFFPQALGGYKNAAVFPEGAYSGALLFATLCSIAVWVGFEVAKKKAPVRSCWLDDVFDWNRLYGGSVFLCVAGFYFAWKLMNLPEEMLAQTQWSGATVKYLFLASIGTIGFYALWLLYLGQNQFVVPKLLVFIVPNLLMLLNAAVVHGRRAGMMNLAALGVVGVWFTRRWTLPRGLLIGGLVVGLVIVNSVGLYRAIMAQEDLSLKERLAQVVQSDLVAGTKEVSEASGGDFLNYLYYRQVIAEEARYDFGVGHWNGFVFNFVPAQLVGRAVKDGLMITFEGKSSRTLARERYGHVAPVGTVSTGYCDAFESFGWLGFVKFSLIGWIMGTLYRHGMAGHFLGQLLYIYLLADAMQAISHGTNAILVSKWVYFFALGYPIFYFARRKAEEGAYMEINQGDVSHG
jgi:hypothetical protein